MPCKYKWQQLTNVNGALRALGLSPYALKLPVYSELMSLRRHLLADIMPATPRASMLLRIITGLSPGSVRVWFDTERGWMAEGRKTPASNPVFHQITEAEAVALMQEHPDPDLAHRVMEPDPYIAE